jgi:hypothetical protein
MPFPLLVTHPTPSGRQPYPELFTSSVATPFPRRCPHS